MIGDEFLTEERDRKYYADNYTCCPPPLFIVLITLVEVSTCIGNKPLLYEHPIKVIENLRSH